MPRLLAALAVVLVTAVAAPAAQAAGAISGHVQDLDGFPIQDICVRAHAPDAVGWFDGPHVVTDTNGDYTISGVEAGSYKVVFWDTRPACDTGGDFYLDQWFNDKPDAASADIVAVTDGTTTTGIDATMAEPEAIGGRVTDKAAQPIEAICVSVVSTSDTNAVVGFDYTDADGHYFAKVPAAGTYKVHFFDSGFSPCAAGVYAEQWYHDKPDAASADAVQVLSNRATFGVDASMFDVATISGHVQDESGQPIADLCIVANPPPGPVPGAIPPVAKTDTSGNYEMDVQPGDWKVQFYDGGVPCTAVHKWTLQYYSDKYLWDLADVIHVVRGQHVTGINATMKLYVPPQPVSTPPSPPPPPPPPVVKCRVPRMHGLTLAKAKRALLVNHCRLGKVTRKATGRRLVGRILSSKPGAHAERAEGAKVALVIGQRRPRA